MSLPADSRSGIRRAIDVRTRERVEPSSAPRTRRGGSLADFAIDEANGDSLLALDIAATAYVALKALKAQRRPDGPVGRAMILDRRWPSPVSRGRLRAETTAGLDPLECLRCRSSSSSHAWLLVVPPRADPEPGMYCHDCADEVGIIDDILQRLGGAEIEIPPDAFH